MFIKRNYNLRSVFSIVIFLIVTISTIVVSPSFSIGSELTISKINVGGAKTVLLKSDGTVWERKLETDNFEKIVYLTDIIDIQTYRGHSFALKKDGTVWGWGDIFWVQDNSNYQNTNGLAIRIEGLSKIKQIGTGAEFLIALDTDGNVYTAGNNTSGQLGTGGRASSGKVQKLIYVNSVVKIAAGSDHCLALKGERTLWAWGNNKYGQCGSNPTMDKVNVPIKVSSASDIVDIFAGDGYSIVQKSDGKLLSFGKSLTGTLQTDQKSNLHIPTEIKGIENVVSVSCGANHVLALQSDSSVYSWGRNSNGQLGIGSSTDIIVPTKINGIKSAVNVLATGNTSLIINSKDEIFIFGDDMYTWSKEKYQSRKDDTSGRAVSPTKTTYYTNKSRDIDVLLDATKLEFDVKPLIRSGRTLVPVRTIFEAMQLDVKWDEASYTVTCTKDTKVIKLVINANTAMVDGKSVPLDVPATIVNGRTLIPLRFLAESLGTKVDWDDSTKTVIIASKQYLDKKMPISK